VNEERDEILFHYESVEEENRLLVGRGQIEFVRTQEVLRRHLPSLPARVLDVGGATGIHSRWLAEEGYQVTLIDLSPRHIELAQASLADLGVEVQQGDARSLRADPDSFDAVLLMGPLYHLQDPTDRLKVWREARRVARPGGIVVGAAISRFASLFDGLSKQYLFDPEFRDIVYQDVVTGRHENPDRVPGRFTTAYFHHPNELRAEADTAGLTVRELVGLEGLPGWLPFSQDRWDSPVDREIILDVARLVEDEPSLAGLSGHLLLICEDR
jgi:2-polyprenyl-3-methyl-5-hydroxy-6-metoxy-1,4-benzoquinol methylase